MVAIMGTSTCHVMNSDVLREVPGMCGVVEGGITPGLWGYEAGQSGVGDIFGWFIDPAGPGRVRSGQRDEAGLSVHEHLTALAAEQLSASTACLPSTGTAATARCWSTTTSAA